MNEGKRNNHTKNIICLILADIIWGAAFVAQRTGGDAVGAYSFNCVRSFVALLALGPMILIRDKMGASSQKPVTKADKKYLWIGGTICGIALGFASNFQQLGISLGSSVGKAGFLTSCYILIVPLLGLFFRKKPGLNVWIGVLLALAGLYLLCMTDGSFEVTTSDMLLLLCALAFAVQITAIDHFAPRCDTVRLSFIEFLVCGLFSLVPTVIFEMGHTSTEISAWASNFVSKDAIIAILYAGLGSNGIAYTLQIAGQKNFNPTLASLMMSLESVVSVLCGWLFLHESLSGREIAGCLALFAAVIIAQVNFHMTKKTKYNRPEA